MSIRKVLQASPEISAEAKALAYQQKLNASTSIAISNLSADQHMVAVLSKVPQRGFHRWAYEIVALDAAGIYKGSVNQVREAQNMIAEWEGKRTEERAAA